MTDHFFLRLKNWFSPRLAVADYSNRRQHGWLGGWILGCLLVLAPAAPWAREGVDVGKTSIMTKLVPAEQVEGAATQQYQQLLQEARSKRALAPDNAAQLVRLRQIAARIIPYTRDWNPRADQWRWEVNLIGSKQVNAFCMPGGKIAFFTGIIDKLNLTDDEIAIVMGHEIAHALREHAREQMGKNVSTNIAAGLVSQIFGFGNMGNQLLSIGQRLVTLKFSRSDESEADLVGMELAARAGYDPRAGVSLWHKMSEASEGAPLEMLSTHPSDRRRIEEIEANLSKVMPLYERAAKPPKALTKPS